MASVKSCLSRAKPYVAMTSLQFGYAGMNIISKVSLNRGMSHFVLVVYRHAVAAAVMAPFAFCLERKVRPKLTIWIFCQLFVLGLLGPVIDQNFYYAGLKYTTPTFACAMSNVMPAMTFVLAALFRMERVRIKQVRSQAKVAGTLVCVGGAMLMTLYKGPVVQMFWHSRHHHSSSSSMVPLPSDKDWIKGSLFLVAACMAWAAFFVLQAGVSKTYPAQFSLTTLVCFLGTLQSMVVAFIFERNRTSIWALGWDMNLLAAVYSGVVTSGIAYYVQGLCMEIKGPVFATAFSPLMMIIVAIMGSIILSENIYLGCVVGGVLIVAGLYAVLWGKVKDHKMYADKNSMNSPEVLPDFDSTRPMNNKNVRESPMDIILSADKQDEVHLDIKKTVNGGVQNGVVANHETVNASH